MIVRFQSHDGVAADLGFNGLHSNFKKPMRNAIKGIHGRTGFAPSGISLQRTINQPIGSSHYPLKVPALMDMDIDMNGNKYLGITNY